MDKTVTVIRGGWWLPRRVLAAGETLVLDADTADALARRGIVRIDDAGALVASNADTPRKTGRKPASKDPSKEL